MPTKTHIDRSGTLTVFKVTGVLGFDEAAAVVKSFISGDQTLYTLWDLLEVTGIDITSEQMEEIATLPTLFPGKRNQGKAAIVVTQTHIFGLARMLEIQAELTQVPYPIMVFRSIEEAYRWFDES